MSIVQERAPVTGAIAARSAEVPSSDYLSEAHTV
jgi:hypothetical protein